MPPAAPDEVPDEIRAEAEPDDEFAVWCSDGDWQFARTRKHAEVIAERMKDARAFFTEDGRYTTKVFEL